ncbi:hypothetical protein LTR86_004015 [Recurvomyces mirabilis]|nr:hypothetical protein LTR86_004015 [Recurvomyces mirabilis]
MSTTGRTSIQGCICGESRPATEPTLTCIIYQNPQHYTCIVAEEIYDDQTALHRNFTCDTCSDEQNTKLNLRLQPRREASIQSLEAVISPFAWETCCRLPDSYEFTTGAVIAATQLDETTWLPVRPVPTSFTEEWKGKLREMCSYLDNVTLSKLAGTTVALASAGSRGSSGMVMQWIGKNAGDLVQKQRIGVWDLGVLGEMLGWEPKGRFWKGR